MTPIGVEDEARASARITMRNAIAARWVLVGLAASLAALVYLAGDALPAGLLPGSQRPWGVLVAIACWAGLNLGSSWAVRQGHASERLAGAHLLVDAFALTVLLALSGGPANPFTVLYFLPITLATQVSPRWTWAIAGVCVLSFASLFALSPVLEGSLAHAEHGHAAMGHGHGHGHAHAAAPTDASPFEGHMRGMWVAFGLAGLLVTVFVHRIALALARQRRELARLRRVAWEDRHLTAIGTLAAGAAHELGTPLATLKVLTGELAHLEGAPLREAQAAMDAALDRCKLIVSKMASPELRVSALPAGEGWPLGDLAGAVEGEPLAVPVHFEFDADAEARRSLQPFEVLAQLLRELIHNAVEACRGVEGEAAVTVHLGLRDDDGGATTLAVEVVDSGVGMDADALSAAFDPFRTTRAEGAGMGLGLYLARAHLRQLGGRIALSSTLGAGTRARFELPLRDPREAKA